MEVAGDEIASCVCVAVVDVSFDVRWGDCLRCELGGSCSGWHHCVEESLRTGMEEKEKVRKVLLKISIPDSRRYMFWNSNNSFVTTTTNFSGFLSPRSSSLKKKLRTAK